jgi:hypothetical protein
MKKISSPSELVLAKAEEKAQLVPKKITETVHKKNGGSS